MGGVRGGEDEGDDVLTRAEDIRLLDDLCHTGTVEDEEEHRHFEEDDRAWQRRWTAEEGEEGRETGTDTPFHCDGREGNGGRYDPSLSLFSSAPHVFRASHAIAAHGGRMYHEG
jgi:hypothetical protein